VLGRCPRSAPPSADAIRAGAPRRALSDELIADTGLSHLDAVCAVGRVAAQFFKLGVGLAKHWFDQVKRAGYRSSFSTRRGCIFVRCSILALAATRRASGPLDEQVTVPRAALESAANT